MNIKQQWMTTGVNFISESVNDTVNRSYLVSAYFVKGLLYTLFGFSKISA